MSKKWRKRVAVITGAASGIGRAVSECLAERGACLHLVDIHRSRLESLGESLRRLGAQVSVYVADCSRETELRPVAEAIWDASGRVDLLHNNAGTCVAASFETLRLEDWQSQLDNNLWSTILGLHLFVPRMRAQGHGVIVNTASIAGLLPLPYTSAYAASKAAVVALSESLSAELAPQGIRVIAVCPGMVATGLLEHARLELPAGAARRIQQLFPWGTRPERVARQIVQAVEGNDRLVVLGGWMQPLWWLRRLSPGGSRSFALWLGRFGAHLTRRAVRR